MLSSAGWMGWLLVLLRCGGADVEDDFDFADDFRLSSDSWTSVMKPVEDDGDALAKEWSLVVIAQPLPSLPEPTPAVAEELARPEQPGAATSALDAEEGGTGEWYAEVLRRLQQQSVGLRRRRRTGQAS